MKRVRFVRSKIAAGGAAGGMFVAVWAWAAAAGWQGQTGASVAGETGAAGGTVVHRIYLVQRAAPDGTTYTLALPALPDGSAPPGVPASVTRAATSSQQQPAKARPVTRTHVS